MIVAALTGLGVVLATFGALRVRTLDLAHRMEGDFDRDAVVVPQIGSALLIGIGVGLVVLAWTAFR